MGKWCSFAFNHFYTELNEEAKGVLTEVEQAFYGAVGLPLSQRANLTVHKISMQTVGRVVANEKIDDRTKQFLLDNAARIGRVATHVARQFESDEIKPTHIKTASRLMFERTERLIKAIQQAA